MDEILRLFGGAENIWAAIQNNAGKVGVETTRVMLELFYVLKNPDTSIIDKTLIVTALGYQLLPEDVLPREKYGLLGFLDNFVTIGFAYSRVKSSVTPQIANQVNNILYQWFGVESSQQQLGNDVPSYEPQQLAQPVYQPVQPQQTPTPNPYVPPQKPIWNDDEEVVID